MNADSSQSPEGAILTPEGWVSGKVEIAGRLIAAVSGDAPANFCKPCWTAPGSVAAMAWAFMIAARNAAAVCGYLASQDPVTMYPLIGRVWLWPWFGSASGTAPLSCSASLT